ncbi:MAG TPA: DUF192 domain-containing protein [Ilumatobacteraceae bacterium]|nr:DUF192 domain-containing protein [Ilumatobacteraceae bacterium]
MIGRSSGFAIITAALLTVTACADDAVSVTDDPAVATTPSDIGDESTSESVPDPAVVQGRQPEGFTTIQALITEPDGEVCEVCLWLAGDTDEHGRGLMGVTDLGDPVGMAFRFDEPRLGSFYMFQTPTPLSIAWFAFGGFHIGATDMAPCLDTPAGECALYSPGVEYDLAIEVFQGGLEPLGLVPGSRVELIEGSEADGCPLDS